MTTATRGRVRVEKTAKRVRTYLGGELVADTTNALMVWEKPYYPTYYFPAEDVNTDLLVTTGETNRSPSRGTAEVFTVETARTEAIESARWYKEANIDELVGHIRFAFGDMDSWFEEAEQIYVHPRDPYTRIDILDSQRHIEVMVNGVKVADSHHPKLLFETGLPTRYYLPKTDVRMDLLVDTDLETSCPYKGTANYYSVELDGDTADNVVWWYKHPVTESAEIAGYVSFYNEKVEITVDGELEAKPKTVFS